MIGNTIIYKQRSEIGNYEWETEGLVVDAYTEVSGQTKGDSAFGFGEVRGNVRSSRMYKVQVYYKHSDSYTFVDIRAYQLVRIVKFANQVTEDKNDVPVNL